MGNRNSSSSKIHGKGKGTRVASTEHGYYNTRKERPVAKFRNDQYVGKHKVAEQQYYNTPLDNDETFTSFIRRAKYKIRTVSHIGQEQSNVAPPPLQKVTVIAEDNQNDQFSNFILSTKKKLRTTSSMRKNGSFNSN